MLKVRRVARHDLKRFTVAADRVMPPAPGRSSSKIRVASPGPPGKVLEKAVRLPIMN
jgi:hypothetical protein